MAPVQPCYQFVGEEGTDCFAFFHFLLYLFLFLFLFFFFIYFFYCFFFGLGLFVMPLMSISARYTRSANKLPYNSRETVLNPIQ